MVRRVLLRGAPTRVGSAAAGKDVAKYWTRHNVTLHRHFVSPQESLEYFHWRNDQYFSYIKLMPVSGQDGRTVLDYGCGPGHDLIGFGVYSKPQRLIGMDVSPSSLQQAKVRANLHGIAAELILLDPSSPELPLNTASVDHVHSSGVLHHVPDPGEVLRELRRVLKPSGTANVMVYNYDSLWLHLYVAHQKCLVENAYPELSIRDAFARTTDGEDCPISRVYRPSEFIELCKEAGFEAEWAGAAISMHEAGLFSRRHEAVMNPALRAESRRFLLELELDPSGFPTYRGHYAGVDGCFRLRASA